MKTSPLIILTMGASTILSVASSDIHARADIDDLKTVGETSRKLNYATFEPDKWLLDGNTHFAPDPAHIGFVSDILSGADSNFVDRPVFTITLDNVIDIEQGIGLEFSRVSGDYSDWLRIDYKDSSNVLIQFSTVVPTDYSHFAPIAVYPVENVKYIVITFYSTNIPYRFIRLLDISVDGVAFTGSNIRAVNIVEEIVPLSVESPSNVAEFTLYSEDGDFSIVDPSIVYAKLKENQAVDIYEFVDDDRLYMGRFYLKTWESKGEYLADFECVDALALLEKIPYSGAGKYLYVPVGIPGSHIDVENFVLDLFSGTNFTYEIDEDLKAIIVNGYAPYGTNSREVLQQMAFASGAYITCSRSNVIQIKEMRLVDGISSWDHVLGASDIGSPNLRLKPLVTGVDLTALSYPTNTQHVFWQIHDGDIEVGEHIFFYPVDYLAMSSAWDGTVTGSIESEIGYAIATVTGAGTLNWTVGTSKVHQRELYQFRLDGLSADVPENIIVIKDALYVTPENVSAVGSRIMNYYQQRNTMQLRLFASGVAIGDSVKIATQKSKNLIGIVERLSLDLVGGFTQDVLAVGNIDP